MGFLHKDTKATNFEFVVLVSFGIEPQLVGKARAAAAFHTDTEAMIFGDVLAFNDVA